MRTIRTERELIMYLRMLREQAADPAAPASPSPAAPASPAPAAQQETPPEAPAKPITVDDIIERLNIVRSGRSTKDVDVKRELEEYIAQFTEDEKTALLAFLEGLGQILTSGVESSAAVDPQDPYAIQIKKSLSASASNATKTPTTSSSPPPAPTPGPVPIKIGG